ncbi:thiazole synthase [Psychromonas arctica]|uniref:thiazole synthase n=1 Tax=Psychromonas arctica TaxID=168275 RepID=UPI002FD4ADD1
MLFEEMMNNDQLVIGDKQFESRLFTGTGKFNDQQTMVAALKASKSELVTMALKRVDMQHKDDDILAPLIKNGMNLLPNTSGARNAKEAVFAAELAREALQTNWVKLEIHPDPKYLLPDPIETLKAAEMLANKGFVILPYVHADPVLCKHLESAGCAAVMPLGAPIGSNKGIKTAEFLDIIIEQATVPVIVDAGLGSPSHAALAMEMGADAVLVNTAIAVAGNPVAMSEAFAKAVQAGRQAYLAGLGGQSTEAVASSPLTAFLEASL